eukprot:UN11240
MCFQILSANYGPQHVRKRIELYDNETFAKTLTDMTEDAFKENIESLIEEKQAPDDNYRQIAGRLWGEISSRTYVWDRRHNDVEYLENFKKKDT